MSKLSCLVLLLVLLVPASARGQGGPPPTGPTNEQTNLDAIWQNVCSAVLADPTRQGEDEFWLRCDEILNAGPGGVGRFNSAAVGNNLGVIGAQGRIRRQQEEALTDVDLHSLNVFATLQNGWMSRDASVFENAFDSNVIGALVGVDYLPSPTSVAGLTLAYSKTNGDFANGAGEVDTKTLSVTAFQSHSLNDRVGFDTYLGVGAIDLNSVRGINYLLVLNAGQPNEQMLLITGTALGETKGHEFVGGAGLAGDANLGRVILSPRGRMDYLQRNLDRYEETDDVGMALSFPNQSIVSLTASVGAEFSLPLSQTWGVLTPSIRLDYMHEFRNGSREIVASFVGDPANYPILVNTQSPDRDFSTIGGSVVALMNSGFAVFMDFNSLVGHGYLNDQNLALGFRAELQ